MGALAIRGQILWENPKKRHDYDNPHIFVYFCVLADLSPESKHKCHSLKHPDRSPQAGEASAPQTHEDQTWSVIIAVESRTTTVRASSHLVCGTDISLPLTSCQFSPRQASAACRRSIISQLSKGKVFSSLSVHSLSAYPVPIHVLAEKRRSLTARASL